MAKATLINEKGKKVVVEAGSQDAQQYFGQGYKLMTGKPAPPISQPASKTPPKANAGAPNPNATGAPKATLINAAGQKVVVQAGSPEAQQKFGEGYALMGKDGKPIGPQAEIAQINDGANADQNTELATIQEETGKVDLSSSADLVKKITGILDEKPAPFSAEKTFEEQKSNLGVDALETDLAGKDAALKQLDADYASTIQDTEGELLSMDAIRRKQSAQGIQYDRIRRDMVVERDSVASSLNTKMNTINTIMQLKQTDYQNAKQDFTDKFNMAIAIQDQLYKQEDRDIAKKDRATAIKDKAKNEARANLTTMTNLMKESKKTWDQLDPSMKANFTKLELESGLPMGSVSSFMNVKPDAKLLATHTGYDASGNKIASFIYADKNGMPGVIKTVKTGGVKEKKSTSGTGTSETSLLMGGKDFAIAAKNDYIRRPSSDGGFDFFGPGGKPITVQEYSKNTYIPVSRALEGSSTAQDKALSTPAKEPKEPTPGPAEKQDDEFRKNIDYFKNQNMSREDALNQFEGDLTESQQSIVDEIYGEEEEKKKPWWKIW